METSSGGNSKCGLKEYRIALGDSFAIKFLGACSMILSFASWIILIFAWQVVGPTILLLLGLSAVGLFMFLTTVTYASLDNESLILRTSVATFKGKIHDIRSLHHLYSLRASDVFANRLYFGYTGSIRLQHGPWRFFLIQIRGRRDRYGGEQFFDFVRAAWEASRTEGTMKPVTHPKSAPGGGNINDAAVHSKRASWFFQGLGLVVVLGLVVISWASGVDMFLDLLKPAIVVLWILGYAGIYFSSRGQYLRWLNERGWDHVHETMSDENIRLLHDLGSLIDLSGGSVDHFVADTLPDREAQAFWGPPAQSFLRLPFGWFMNSKSLFQQVSTGVASQLAVVVQQHAAADERNVCVMMGARAAVGRDIGSHCEYEGEACLLISKAHRDDLQGLEEVIQEMMRLDSFVCIFTSGTDRRLKEAPRLIEQDEVQAWADHVAKIAIGAYNGQGYLLWSQH